VGPSVISSLAAQPLTRIAVGVLLSTKANPSQQSDFNTTIVPLTKQSGQGTKCLPIDITVAGIADGANVTLELVYNGPDGILYQVRIP
jgi:hypothetical protein